MKIKQLSLFLENKTGALSRPVKLLAKAKLNILTLSIADTQQYGILRFVLPIFPGSAGPGSFVRGSHPNSICMHKFIAGVTSSKTASIASTRSGPVELSTAF